MWKKYKCTWYLVATSLGWWSGRMCRWDCSTFCRPRWGSQRSHPPASVTQINQSIHSNWPFRKLNLIKKFQLILFTSRQLIISFSNADLMSLFYFNRIRIRAQHFSSDPDPNWTKFFIHKYNQSLISQTSAKNESDSDMLSDLRNSQFKLFVLWKVTNWMILFIITTGVDSL